MHIFISYDRCFLWVSINPSTAHGRTGGIEKGKEITVRILEYYALSDVHYLHIVIVHV
jgi:hypothetical protein